MWAGDTKQPTICGFSFQIMFKYLIRFLLVLTSHNFSLGVTQQRGIAGSLFLGIQFDAGGWRGRGLCRAGSRAQVSCAVNSLVFVLQVVSLFFWCFLTNAWDVFFPTMRNKSNSQYSDYSNGVRHTCLISVLAFLESFVDYVSCCVQNSHLLSKTVSTPVHPSRQSRLPIFKWKYSSFSELLPLRKGLSSASTNKQDLVPSFCLVQSHIFIRLSELSEALSTVLPLFSF